MTIQTKTISLTSIKPAPYNPRKQLRPGDPEYQHLLNSVERFGMVQPLIWNCRTKHLVGGHQRLTILTARGETHADVVVVDLPLNEEKALNLALNKIDGRWDEKLLSDVLGDLIDADELDLGCTGFTSSEIDELTSGLLDDLTPPPAEEPYSDLSAITQTGEIVELGPHRVLCGDMTDREGVARLLEADRADLVFTDPPYSVNYNSRHRPTPGSRKHRAEVSPGAPWDPIQNDKLTPRQYRAWFERVVEVLSESMLPGASYYLWNGHANFGLMSELLSDAKMKPRQVITWAKESFAPGFSDYNEQTEFCLYGWKSGPKGVRHRWQGPKNESTLWQVSRERTVGYTHPTQKALPLAERAIRNSSKHGDWVLDPFLGSGTTLIAAARLGRRCLGVELEPKYVDVTVRRFIATVGRSAVPPEVAERYLGSAPSLHQGGVA
ncbi:MAG: DNA modification methylase [Pseudomonadota bacterium]